MSYDIWLEIDTGGAEPAAVGASRNMTSNVARMWREAGIDLSEVDGELAGDQLPALRDAIKNMKENPGKYELMNPINGWGSYDTCLAFLLALEQDWEAHPKAKIGVWH
jgi:hypothetical protein